MSNEFKACGVVPMAKAGADTFGRNLTLEKMLDYQDTIKVEADDPWFQKVAKQAQNENGKLAVHLKNGVKVVFADFHLPNDMLCIPSSSFDLLPSQVLMFLAKNNLPTEDVEIGFVGGTIVRKKKKEETK